MGPREFWNLVPAEWDALIEVYAQEQRARAHDVATICATIMNMSGKQVQRPVKVQDLLPHA